MAYIESVKFPRRSCYYWWKMLRVTNPLPIFKIGGKPYALLKFWEDLPSKDEKPVDLSPPLFKGDVKIWELRKEAYLNELTVNVEFFPIELEGFDD